MFHGPIVIVFSEVSSRLQNIPVFFLFAYFQERVGGLVLFEFKKKLPIHQKLFISVSFRAIYIIHCIFRNCPNEPLKPKKCAKSANKYHHLRPVKIAEMYEIMTL